MKIRTQFLILATAVLSPGLTSAATIYWNASNGDLGISTNWNPNTAISATGNAWTISNGGTATVGSGKNYTLNNVLYVGESAGSGTLLLSGNGTLGVTGGNVSIGNSASGGSGTVTLSGTSQLSAGSSLYVGNRTTGTLTANAGTKVSVVGALAIGTGATGANGTVNLYGTLTVDNATASSVRLGSISASATQATFNTYAGSSFSTAGGLILSSDVPGTFSLNLNGSGSTFAVAKDIAAANSSSVFSFLADSGGITTVASSQTISISGAALKLNIDAYLGSQNLVLFSGNTINGTFGSVEWLGTTQGTLVYGSNSIYVTAVPEPSVVVCIGFGFLVIVAAKGVARRKKQHA